MLPKATTSIPASVNLSPANKIIEGTCSVSTENSVYPIFTQGKALPQRMQHIMAPMHTTAGFVKNAAALPCEPSARASPTLKCFCSSPFISIYYNRRAHILQAKAMHVRMLRA